MTNFVKNLTNTIRNSFSSPLPLIKFQPRKYILANYRDYKKKKLLRKCSSITQKLNEAEVQKSSCVELNTCNSCETSRFKRDLPTSNNLKPKSGNSSKKKQKKVCNTSMQINPIIRFSKQWPIIPCRNYAKHTSDLYQRSLKTYEAVRRIIKNILQKSSRITSFNILHSSNYIKATDSIRMNSLPIKNGQMLKNKFFYKESSSRVNNRAKNSDLALAKRQHINNTNSSYSTSSCGCYENCPCKKWGGECTCGNDCKCNKNDSLPPLAPSIVKKLCEKYGKSSRNKRKNKEKPKGASRKSQKSSCNNTKPSSSSCPKNCELHTQSSCSHSKCTYKITFPKLNFAKCKIYGKNRKPKTIPYKTGKVDKVFKVPYIVRDVSQREVEYKVDRYFGDSYENKEYFFFHKRPFYEVESLHQGRCPPSLIPEILSMKKYSVLK